MPAPDDLDRLSHAELKGLVVKPALPRGSRFKGYTSFVVQDLVIRPHVVNFRCERWQAPDGGMVTAPLPAGIDGHFGPERSPDRASRPLLCRSQRLERPPRSARCLGPQGQSRPVMVATEAALWGSVKAHGFLPDTVIVIDDAGQFNVGQHGLCWVHSERLVHMLDAFTDENRTAQATARKLIWNFYRDLKAYRCGPTQTAQGSTAGAVRPHLQAQDRLRHPRPTARAAQTQTSPSC
jgi:hypothetical protein